MRTQKQIATTPEGKARILYANLDTGIFAETQVLVWEDQSDLEDSGMNTTPPSARIPRSAVSPRSDSHVRVAPSPLHLRGFPMEPALRRQHRINSTRRAFHTALKELERLEARDHDAVAVSPAFVPSVTQTPETQLPILGSLRKNDSGDPAGGKTPSVPALEQSESVIEIDAPGSGSSQHSKKRGEQRCG